eukprot:2303128-Amphidinium_carterae.1
MAFCNWVPSHGRHGYPSRLLKLQLWWDGATVLGIPFPASVSHVVQGFTPRCGLQYRSLRFPNTTKRLQKDQNNSIKTQR